MKKLYTILFAAFLSVTAFAQLPDGSVAPNFTVTDIDGSQHELYDYLNDGKVVIIDLFATWCGPCWNYHQAHVLEDAFQQYGPGGTDELVVLGIEGDGSTALECIYGPTDCNSTTYGDWTEGISYPIINDSSIPSLYNLAYWPTLYIIYPTRISNEMGQASLAGIGQWLANKPALSAGLNPQLLEFKGYNGGICTDLLPDAPYYFISNLGEETITSADITVDIDGTVIYEEAFAGEATSYQAIAEIQLPTQIFTENSLITLTMANINGDVNESFTHESAITFEADNAISVTVEADANTSDDNTRYQIMDEAGNILFAQALEPGAGVQTYTHTLPSMGCYEIMVIDNGANGLDNPMVARDGAGNIVYSNNGFAGVDIQEFNVASLSSVKDILTDVNMFLSPNPASTELNVNLDLEVAQDFTLNITNVSGQLVQRQNLNQLNAGNNRQAIDISTLSNGLYFLTISGENGQLTKRFIKN